VSPSTRTPDRDPIVAEALEGITVPEHGPTFWDDLDAALTTPVPVARNNEIPTDIVHDLAPVVPLRTPSTAARWRIALVATTAAALLAVGAAVAMRSNETDLDLKPAVDPSVAPSTVPAATVGPDPRPNASTATTPSTVASTTPSSTRSNTASSKVGKATPDAAVVAWIEALGAGRIDAAVALVGPRSEAYIRSLGANVRGVMTESQEGYGAWANTPDRSTTEIDLGVVSDVSSTVVAVSGTWRGEGEDGFRVDAVPATKSGRNGTWLVEPMAFEPKSGGRLEPVRPSAGENGLNGLAADATLEATAPGKGTFWFSLDDSAPVKVPGKASGSGVRGTWDPPGHMRSRSHLLVVAYADGATFTAFAGIFAVEG